jgi:hypothetical protein
MASALTKRLVMGLALGGASCRASPRGGVSLQRARNAEELHGEARSW